MDKSGRVWSSWEEVQQYALTQADGVIPGKVTESMFARPDSSESSGLPLDRCMRVYAHQQDTGGFFITVLEKKGEIKAKPEAPPKAQSAAANGSAEDSKVEVTEETEAKMDVVRETEEQKAAEGEPTDVLPTVAGEKRPLDDEADESAAPEAKKQRTVEPEDVSADSGVATAAETPAQTSKNEEDDETSAAATPAATSTTVTNPNQLRRRGADGVYEEPFKYLPLGHEIIGNIEAFYKISSRFPSDRYMVRNATGEPAKAIYYTSPYCGIFWWRTRGAA